jgi:hypothetical protein
MKKYLLVLFLFGSFIFVFPSFSPVYSINPFESAPECGFEGLACCGSVDNTNDINAAVNEHAPAGLGGTILGLLGGGIDSFRNSTGGVFSAQCLTGQETPQSDGSCKCVSVATAATEARISYYCGRYIDKRTPQHTEDLAKCLECSEDNGGLYTGLGCIPTTFSSFVSNFLLGFGISLGGGISLMCIIYSAFMIQTSRGNADKIQHAQEQLTACITGLMLIIFSIFILRVIGVDILKIPGFQ